MSAAAKALWEQPGTTWPECSVISEPVKSKLLKEPRVLVKRNLTDLEGSRGERLIYLPGQPTISLFTGAGGLDLGMENAGFCSLVQHEWNDTACQTLIANRPRAFRNAALIQGDIRNTPTTMLLREADLRVGEAAMVCGGPPCQGFSTANKHTAKGTYDTRNDLVFEFLRVVRETQPAFFLMENVPGFVGFNKSEYLRAYLRAAYDSFYELVYALMDAASYGVPQRRVRFFCMGTRRDLNHADGLLGSMPRPQNFGPSDLRLIRAGGFESARRTRAPGIRYFPDRPVLVPPYPVHDDHFSRSHLEFYDKLHRDEPDRVVFEPKNAAA